MRFINHIVIWFINITTSIFRTRFDILILINTCKMKKLPYIIILFFISIAYLPVKAQTFKSVVVSKLGKSYTPPPSVKIFQTKADASGTTSIRNISQPYLEWKTEGYFMRNRDLGQVFTTTNQIQLESIVLRTGPSEKAVLSSTAGKKVFIQFFEVSGTPVINDNGTPVGTKSTHGYTTNHRADDYIQGVTYTSFTDIYQGIFPDIPATYDNVRQRTLGTKGTLYYMRWKFESPIRFEAGKRYAFIVGFSEPGDGLGFTVANINSAGSPAAPSLTDNAAYYKGGWGIRREGDGTLPPTMVPGPNPPTNSVTRNQLITESLFPTGSSRYALKPTSDGYPDVDTYRALEFYLEEVQTGW